MLNFYMLALPAAGYLIFHVIYAVAVHLNRQRIINERQCKPPPGLPQLDPFFGLDLVFQVLSSFRAHKRNESFKEQFDKFGPTFQSQVYGRTKLFTIDLKNLQSIFATDFASWGVQPLRLFFFGPFVGKGIMTTDGAFWEHSRTLMKPTFSRFQVANLSAYSIHVDRLINLIPNGSEVDLQTLFARLALDSSTELLFGQSTACLAPTTTIDAKNFLEAYNYGQAGVGKRMQLPQWNFLTRDERFWSSCAVAREFVEKHVEKALRSRGVSNDDKDSKLILAHEIAKQTDDRDDIRNQLLNVFLPAHDATAVALTNVFFHLARNPEVYAELRQEVLTADETEWTFEGLKGLKYLQNVMNETFRLNPSIGQMNRVALRDTVLPSGGGATGTSPIFVKKGSVVTTSFYALHRLPQLFGSDAQVFRPERWQSLRLVPWSYLPFGGGPRVCIGQQLALTEVGYTIAKIVQRFSRIENADPVMEFVEQWKITTDSKNGAKVRLFET